MPTAECRKVYPNAAIPKGGEFGGTRNHRGLDHSRTLIVLLLRSVTFKPWAEGKITAIRRSDEGIYGRYIEVKDSEGVHWSYCHAASINNDLRVGDRVFFWTKLGVIGSTGTAIPSWLKGGSKHLHTMCSDQAGAAVDGTAEVFDPKPHIAARIRTKTVKPDAPTATRHEAIILRKKKLS